MKRVMALAILVLLLGATASPAAPVPVPDDKLIVPGQRIGKWTLAMSVDDLAWMNGSPGSRELWKAGRFGHEDLARDVIVIQWDSVLAATVDERSVVGLTITAFQRGSVDYKTTKGIGWESTRAQVLEAYGKPTAETKPRAADIRLIYDEIGIWFRFDSGRLRSMSVFHPGSAKNAWKF